MCNTSWPEQDFVYEWAKKWDVKLGREALLELIEKMTKPRLELQGIRNKVNTYFEENNMV